MTAPAFAFHRATKVNRKARLALAGPSGSGKTWTGLTLLRALIGPTGRMAVIDTERESASLYSDDFEFDALNLHTFNPEDLPKILALATAEQYDGVLVDGMSAFWSGIDGMLQQVDNAARRNSGGNSFGGWKEMRPVERQMIDALLAFPGHVVVTMRTKTEYVVEQNDKGKQVPRKIGTKPEQREGIEYEFDVVGDLDLEHVMTVSKSRCSALADAVIRKPDEKVAETLLTWLNSGITTEGVRDFLDRAADKNLTFDTARDLWQEVKARGLLNAAVTDSTGEPTTLGALIVENGKAAQLADARAEQEAAKAAALARQEELAAGAGATA